MVRGNVGPETGRSGKLQRAVDGVVAKHGLLTRFPDTEVEPAQLDAKINELRGRTGVLPLVRYCPGATNHVAVNTAERTSFAFRQSANRRRTKRRSRHSTGIRTGLNRNP